MTPGLGNILMIEPNSIRTSNNNSRTCSESLITVFLCLSNQYTLVTPVTIVAMRLGHSASTTRLVRLAHRLP